MRNARTGANVARREQYALYTRPSELSLPPPAATRFTPVQGLSLPTASPTSAAGILKNMPYLFQKPLTLKTPITYHDGSHEEVHLPKDLWEVLLPYCEPNDSRIALTVTRATGKDSRLGRSEITCWGRSLVSLIHLKTGALLTRALDRLHPPLRCLVHGHKSMLASFDSKMLNQRIRIAYLWLIRFVYELSCSSRSLQVYPAEMAHISSTGSHNQNQSFGLEAAYRLLLSLTLRLQSLIDPVSRSR